MWEKIKSWWVDRKARKEEKKMKKRMDLEIALNRLLLDGPNWVAYDIHDISKLFVSIFFESDKDWIAVDFSEEDKGIAQFIIFTPDPMDKFDPTIEVPQKEIHTLITDATVFKKYYEDGSEGWCYIY